jgi:hypothetical protein
MEVSANLTVVDRNDYPREALFEAIIRYIEEDLADPLTEPHVPSDVDATQLQRKARYSF